MSTKRNTSPIEIAVLILVSIGFIFGPMIGRNLSSLDPYTATRVKGEDSTVSAAILEGRDNCKTNTPETVELINAYRVGVGLSFLETHCDLNLSACKKSQSMVDYDYFSHDYPDGSKFTSVIPDKFVRRGEILAQKFGDKKEQMNAWLNSAAHKSIIDYENYQFIGACDRNNKITVHFGG